MSDINFVSYAGNGSRLVLRKYFDEEGGGVEIFPDDLNFGVMRDIVIPELIVPIGFVISDLLKCSHIRNVRFIIGKLVGVGALEDAGDVLACRNLEFLIDDLWCARRYGFTVKGESKDIRIFVRRQHDHGGEVDYDFGNAVNKDLPQGRTTSCSLNIATVDYSPFTVRVLHAHTPAIENTGHPHEISAGAKGFFAVVMKFLKALFAIFGKKR